MRPRLANSALREYRSGGYAQEVTNAIQIQNCLFTNPGDSTGNIDYAKKAELVAISIEISIFNRRQPVDYFQS